MTDYSVVERRRTIAAPSEQILPLLIDYHRWVEWSPWEGIDPQMERTYEGPNSGVGAAYSWSGNRKAGAGRMEVTDVTPESVAMTLDFTRPFKSAALVRFTLAPTGDATEVVWVLRNPKNLMTRIFGIFVNMDKAVGGDLEKGLAQLADAVER